MEKFLVAIRRSNQFGAEISVPTSGISSFSSFLLSKTSSKADIKVQAEFPSVESRKTETHLPIFVSKHPNASIQLCPARSTSFGALRRLSS